MHHAENLSIESTHKKTDMSTALAVSFFLKKDGREIKRT